MCPLNTIGGSSLLYIQGTTKQSKNKYYLRWMAWWYGSQDQMSPNTTSLEK